MNEDEAIRRFWVQLEAYEAIHGRVDPQGPAGLGELHGFIGARDPGLAQKAEKLCPNPWDAYARWLRSASKRIR